MVASVNMDELATSAETAEGRGSCSHGKQKAYCRECGGSQVCEHGETAVKMSRMSAQIEDVTL